MNKIKDIGEFSLIDRITKKTDDPEVVVDIGDDAAVIKTKKGLQVLTTDCLVEGDHFRRDWHTPEQIGKKSIEINVSDIAAMGGIPKYALISLGLPVDLDVEYVEKIYEGMWKTCDKYDLKIIGGNMTHSEQIFISVTMTGEVEKKNLSLRNSAKPGDYVFVSGPLGSGRAGLRLFLKEIDGFKKIKKKYLEPQAKLKKAQKLAPYVNSMIDISDGLSPEIKHICSQSRCGAILHKDKIPIDDEVRKVTSVLKEDEYDYALHGGEDFELLFTVSKENLDMIDGYLIGSITEKKEIKIRSDGKEELLSAKGYDHFSNNI